VTLSFFYKITDSHWLFTWQSSNYYWRYAPRLSF